MLFDSHAHLQNRKFAEDVNETIGRAREAGVGKILNLGTRLADSHEVVELARRYPEECLAAVGVHPSDLDAWSPEEEAGLLELAASAPEVVVYGEIGIDYFHNHFDRDTQRRIFRRQLGMARELGLAVSLHCREAYDDLIEDLRAENASEIGGVAHCFAGNTAQAHAIVEMGLALGVGGIATFPKSGDLRETLREIGIDHLLLETDSPYLAPQPRRGKRNEPAFTAFTAETVAKLFDRPVSEVAAVCWNNTVRTFRLKTVEEVPV